MKKSFSPPKCNIQKIKEGLFSDEGVLIVRSTCIHIFRYFFMMLITL